MALHDIDAIRLGEILRAPGEIALIDLRPAIAFGNGAPLHGANVPLVELEARIDALVPHRHTPIALIDGDGSLVRRAAGQLAERGYETVYSLRGGVDDNERLPVVPIRVAAPRIISGDVERSFRTPVTTARELVRLREAGTPTLVLDTRSLEEYAREHIPDSCPAPGGEIVAQFHALVRSPEVRVITTCAGRSRAVLAAQTLIDGGVANPVSTLDFGTLGWRDLGLPLAHGAERAPAPLDAADTAFAATLLAPVSQRFARHAAADLAGWLRDPSRTTYALDVRLPDAFARGHLPGSINAPGGQLGIWLGKWAAVREARLALIDSTPGIRAVTVGQWFARLGWEVAIVEHDFGDAPG